MDGTSDARARREIDRLAWSELADAVWLTLATASGFGPTNVASEREQGDDITTTEHQNDLPAPTPASTTDGPGGGEPSPGQDSLSGVDNVDALNPTQRPIRLGRKVSWSTPAMVRAFSLLKCRVPSRREDEIILDEVATAETAAQAGMWLPVTVPEQTRWLDLVLVVDSGPSMALWQPTVQAFADLLRQLGVFRTIQHRIVDTHDEPCLRGGTEGTPPRSPAELLDTSGRRVILLLTDGISAGWRHNRLSPLLAQWASSMPVAVVHLLPQRLWSRSGIRLRRAKVVSPRPLAPNRRLHLELADAWQEPDPTAAHAPDAVPVPVLELAPRWFASWVRLITTSKRQPTDMVVMLTGPTSGEPDAADFDDDELDVADYDVPTPKQRVLAFVGRASPLSYRLATLLAAVPVSLAVARVVQEEMVPESGPGHLAEVFTSGLLEPLGADAPNSWLTASFEFPDPVRQLLLSSARRSETGRVIQIVADRFAEAGVSRMAIASPDTAPYPTFLLTPTTEQRRRIAVELAVMRALSGPYVARADRLTEAMTRAAQPGPVPIANGDSELALPAHTAQEPPDGSAASTVNADHQDDGPTPLAQPDGTSNDAPAFWDPPPRNSNFTGREEFLAEMSRRLVEGGTTAVLPEVLHGMGGIGKTQVAIEYIYRHMADHDLIWWIPATQTAQIRASLTDLARKLRLPGSTETLTAVPAVREALRTGTPFRRWLLVFDSAESPEAVSPFFPDGGPGTILVTSRNPGWSAVARTLELSVFTREESKNLLCRRGPDIADADADALADKLGDLPLAIAQAAAWRTETGLPVDEYIRLFDEKLAEIMATSVPTDSPSDYEVSLTAAWTVSFDELQSRNPAASQLLQVCAFCAAEPIPRSLFVGVRGLSIAKELDAALNAPNQIGRVLRDINRYGLAKVDHRNRTLLLHRLVQSVLQDRMSPEHAVKMRHGVHQLLANLDPNAPTESAQWPRYRAILPHAYASEVIACDDQWVRELVLNLVTFLYQRGDQEEAARLARQVTESWQTRFDEHDPQLLQAWGRLALYLWNLGRYAEAAAINDHTLELHRRSSGEDSEEALLAERRVAVDRRAKGDFNGALTLNENVYRKARNLFGEDDLVTLNAAHDLGVIRRLLGLYREALELDQSMYPRQVEIRGPDAPQTLDVLGGMILDRLALGHYRWAKDEQKLLAERAARLFGPDTATTLQRRHHLAMAMRLAGDYAGAMAESGQALERYRLRYGDLHPLTLACANDHSINLRNSGELMAARELGEQIVERYRQALGERHPHTLSSAVSLAVTLRLLGEVAAAHRLDEHSLEQFRVLFGWVQPHTLITAINLASDLAALGRVTEAVERGWTAADWAPQVLGIEHPTTLAATMNLASDLRALGRMRDAEALRADAMARYRHSLGPDHPVVLAAERGTRFNSDIELLPL